MHGAPHGLSFRARLTARWTVAFGLVLALANVAIYLGAATYGTRDFDAHLRTVAATELASVVDEYRGVHLDDFPSDLLNSIHFTGKFTQLYDRDGALLMQSPNLAGSGFLLDPAMLRRGVAGQAPIASFSVGGRGGRVLALRSEKAGAGYVVAVGLFTDELRRNLRQLAWYLAVVWLLGLAATAALGFALVSRALEPVDLITARAAAIARGNFMARLDPPRANDEIGRMAAFLNEMIERLEGAIAANRRFAADASHELRSPITAMAGEVDVALKRERTADEYRETLETVRERLSEMTELADNLMLLVRLQEGAGEKLVREVDLGSLVESSFGRLHAQATERGIALDATTLPALIAYGDPGLLARVVDNLVANAVQYNRDAGRVVVSGHYEAPRHEGWAAGIVVLRVTDQGPGIPHDEWEHVFQRFYRRDQSRSRRTGGSGLGLSICRAVATLFDGTVRVVESSSDGTTFEVRLPGQASAAARTDAPGVSERPGSAPRTDDSAKP
jgi:two-component system OmpR family sensor kinase